MFNLTENYKLSRKLASQCMVLLKNNDFVLPFKSTDRVGIVGKECLDIIRGGGGSAHVQTEYVKSLEEGLEEKANENKLCFFADSIKLALDTSDYTLSELNDLAKNIDIAVVTLRRSGTEGADRRLCKLDNLDLEEKVYTGEANLGKIEDYENKVGYFYLSEKELELFANIEKSDIKNVVLLLNIASIVDLSFIENYPKIKSVLLSYLPGMEAGTAIADVLCGDVNPSGKLTDTVAYNYEDYSTADCFDYDPQDTEYKEGIYVGYRYFETKAQDKVMYPFGFGLSYTSFEYSNYSYIKNDDIITLSVDVKNIGSVSGREVVEAYISAPEGKLEKPAIELKGYYKTKELLPNETEKVEITFRIDEMASFDDKGVTGYKAAWVLEKGDYSLFVGKSVRDLYLCGVLNIEETINVEQLQIRFDGSEYILPNNLPQEEIDNNKFSLYDVLDNKISLKDFINTLTVEELVQLSQGQPPALPYGTAGVGNIKKYGVPNSQTADGPAGIRRSVNTTCFPCGTLVACSWDKELQFEMGRALGYEGYNTGIDIILAPSMNIHRNPLGGRNFEYLSEDPYLTGKTAAAIVNGVQSEGLCATVKHFAVNNCEYYRRSNNSIVSERALREVYLKGFEIAVKESNPAFVMTSYNKLNGIHTSANKQLLRGVLRDEWGYDGAVMTDWRNYVSLDDEILAGNNIKMPFGYPDETEKAIKAYENGKISLAVLRENAEYVLKAVMKTRSFIKKDFGMVHHINDKLVIPSIAVNGLSSTRIMQEKVGDEWCLYSLGKDQRAQRTFIYYSIEAENSGEYEVICTVSTNCPNGEIWFFDEDEKQLGTVALNTAVDSNKWYEVKTKINLHKGVNTLKLVFAEDPNEICHFSKEWYVGEGDIKLLKISLELNK